MRGCRLPENLGETPKARNLRVLSGACQKVIECLYIILPSYNTYLITFWHNSALAFILGWSPYERVPSPWESRGDAKSKARNLRDYGNLSGACQNVIECLYIILPSYNTYLITFWHNKLPWSRLAENWPAGLTSHLVIILRWKQGLNCIKRWLNTYYRMAGWY